MPLDLYEYLWFALLIVFIVAEAITVSVVSIWFAFGALVALIAQMLGANLTVQIIIFLIVSGVSLYFTRPLLKKYLSVGKEKTNVAAIIGKRGIITKSIHPNDYGQVKIGGQIWTAKNSKKEVIQLNEEVEVLAVEGVKLIVRKTEE